MLVEDEKTKMQIKVLKNEKPLSAIDVKDKVTTPANVLFTQMMHGAKGANLHRRKDAVAVVMAKVGTRPTPKVRKKVNPKGRSKVQKARRVRKATGPKCRGMEKVRRPGRKDR